MLSLTKISRIAVQMSNLSNLKAVKRKIFTDALYKMDGETSKSPDFRASCMDFELANHIPLKAI